jgi:hypothetical protein
MNRRWLIGSMLVLLGVLILTPSVRAGGLAEFEGGIGVIPVVAGGGANVVRGVSPGGTPWVINKFEAKVEGGRGYQGRGEGPGLGRGK